MDQQPTTTPGLSPLHGLWLLIFVVEAIDSGRGLSHQLGGAALGILFTFLFVTELRSCRKAASRALAQDQRAFGGLPLTTLPLR